MDRALCNSLLPIQSLSDDSVGNEPRKKSSVLETLGQPRNKGLKKHPVPWWISEDHSDDGRNFMLFCVTSIFFLSFVATRCQSRPFVLVASQRFRMYHLFSLSCSR